ncbi:serine hydrolase domain-containing protein [Ferrimonas marina]|uniref:Beta-lactamase n=1 Tax=Ferrimonas marina TaxID=299255 RepID=A0A1M5Z650_9GAMM|nr:serine hydrolase domain-containing protein [Ferrimonas marina]SHI19722.1 Beta-lactamase [Ferrimonas marina]
MGKVRATACLILIAITVWLPRDTAATELHRTLLRQAQELDANGLSVAWVRAEEPIQTFATGYVDPQHNQPMTTHHRFHGGHTGRAHLAALTLLLAQQGVLDLDAPIDQYLATRYPWMIELPNYPTLTIRHLLRHSSGLPDPLSQRRLAWSMLWRNLTDWEQAYSATFVLERLRSRSPLFPAGQQIALSPANDNLLCLIIESATGDDYYRQLYRKVLLPLGLVDTLPANQRQIEGLIPGYLSSRNPLMRLAMGPDGRNLNEQGELIVPPQLDWSGVGLVTTPKMLVRFYHGLFNGQLLDEETLTLLLTPPPLPRYSRPRVNAPYPTTLSLYPQEQGHRLWVHHGYFPGYVTLVHHLPEHNLTLAIQSNQDTLLQAALPKLLGQLQAALLPADPDQHQHATTGPEETDSLAVQ